MGPGSRIGGHYDVVRPLARGGMSDLYVAQPIDGSHSQVVLKVMRQDLSSKQDLAARFSREAKAALALTSPYVVRILDYGFHEESRPFMVLEYLEGHDLARELDLRGVLPVAEAALYAGQLCEAMIEAHAAGIVHRDLKPSNLFLAQVDGVRIVKVLDFGISKMEEPSREEITLTKELFGSPLYMSPEQFRSAKKVDHRTDVWAAGVILYEMLTGLPPFVADNAPSIALAVTREAHVPPTTRRPSLPQEVDSIILRALQKKRELRTPDMRAFLEDVERLLPQTREDTPTNLVSLPALTSQRPVASESIRPVHPSYATLPLAPVPLAPLPPFVPSSPPGPAPTPGPPLTPPSHPPEAAAAEFAPTPIRLTDPRRSEPPREPSAPSGAPQLSERPSVPRSLPPLTPLPPPDVRRFALEGSGSVAPASNTPSLPPIGRSSAPPAPRLRFAWVAALVVPLALLGLWLGRASPERGLAQPAGLPPPIAEAAPVAGLETPAIVSAAVEPLTLPSAEPLELAMPSATPSATAKPSAVPAVRPPRVWKPRPQPSGTYMPREL